MNKAKTRVARRSSDKRWQVVERGRPPAVICETFDEAMAVADILAHSDAPVLERGDKRHEAAKLSIYKSFRLYDAQGHARDLLNLGMGRSHIIVAAGVGTQQFNKILAGDISASDHAINAVLGVNFELTDVEAAALDIEHFMNMGGTAAEAISWWRERSDNPNMQLTAALTLINNRRGEPC